MTLKDIEIRLKDEGIKIRDFKSITSYCILLEGGGSIHLDEKGQVFVQGRDERMKQVYNALGVEPKVKDKTKLKRKQLRKVNGGRK